MNFKRIFLYILCFALAGVFVGCNATPKNSSGIYYPGIEEIFNASKNAYIGKLVQIGDEKKVSSNNVNRNFDIEYEKVIVEVQERYKGSFERNQKIEDWVLSSYADFLEVGNTYIFMTGVDYFQDCPIYYPFNIYEVVKIQGDNKIQIYKLDEYLKKGNYPENRIASPPKSLDEILVIFRGNLELSSEPSSK